MDKYPQGFLLNLGTLRRFPFSCDFFFSHKDLKATICFLRPFFWSLSSRHPGARSRTPTRQVWVEPLPPLSSRNYRPNSYFPADFSLPTYYLTCALLLTTFYISFPPPNPHSPSRNTELFSFLLYFYQRPPAISVPWTLYFLSILPILLPPTFVSGLFPCQPSATLRAPRRIFSRFNRPSNRTITFPLNRYAASETLKHVSQDICLG